MLPLTPPWSASAGPAPADSLRVLPGPHARLSRVLETLAPDGSGYRWPRARFERDVLLADAEMTRAALRDTVSALNARAANAAAAARAREDSLRSNFRWTQLDLEHERQNRPHWWEKPTVVVPVTMFLTLLAVDAAVGD